MKQELKDDFGSILLLLFLYLLQVFQKIILKNKKNFQGVPLGLIAAIPLILQSKEITYAQQAVFSFAYWPFRFIFALKWKKPKLLSMKLLWAPIVDSIYFRRLGRRKSWMVPCQYLIGLFLLVISYNVKEIMGAEDKNGQSEKKCKKMTKKSSFFRRTAQCFPAYVHFLAAEFLGSHAGHCGWWLGPYHAFTQECWLCIDVSSKNSGFCKIGIKVAMWLAKLWAFSWAMCCFWHCNRRNLPTNGFALCQVTKDWLNLMVNFYSFIYKKNAKKNRKKIVTR